MFIPRLKQLHTILYCGGDRRDAADCAIVKAIMKNKQLMHIHLERVSLNDDGLVVKNMTRLQTIVLLDINMSAKLWGMFLTSLLNLKQAVHIISRDTNIDRETVRRVHNSPRITVTRNVRVRDAFDRYYMLDFTTSSSPC